MTGAPANKKRAYRYGRLAEHLAALMLIVKGYRILARRYRTPVGEIDLIARRGRLIAMVEVKARRGAPAAETLGGHQRQRIERAAESYVGSHPGSETYDLRFDLVMLGPGLWPRHLPGAWISGDRNI